MPAPIIDIRSRVLPQPTRSGGFMEGLLPQLNQLLAERQARGAAAEERGFRRDMLESEAENRRLLQELAGSQALEQIDARGDVESDLIGERGDVESRHIGERADAELGIVNRRGEIERMLAELRNQGDRDVARIQADSRGAQFPLAGSVSPLLSTLTGGGLEAPTADQIRGLGAFAGGDVDAAAELLGAPTQFELNPKLRQIPGRADPVELPDWLAGFQQDDIDELAGLPLETHIQTIQGIATPAAAEEYLQLLPPQVEAQVRQAMGRRQQRR